MKSEFDLIQEVEATLTDEHKGHAYRWAESLGDTAHWDAHNEWELALTSGADMDTRLACAQRWRDETVAMFERFKLVHGIDELDMWANELKSRLPARTEHG